MQYPAETGVPIPNHSAPIFTHNSHFDPGPSRHPHGPQITADMPNIRHGTDDLQIGTAAGQLETSNEKGSFWIRGHLKANLAGFVQALSDGSAPQAGSPIGSRAYPLKVPMKILVYFILMTGFTTNASSRTLDRNTPSPRGGKTSLHGVVGGESRSSRWPDVLLPSLYENSEDLSRRNRIRFRDP